MKQSKFMSMLESIINIAVGFGIGLLGQMIFLPLLGVEISLKQNLFFALIMTVVSIARSYLLRRLFEALHIRVPLSPAMLAIAAERRRQIEVEGWDAAHDDAHAPGELAAAGSCYAMTPAWRLQGRGGELVEPLVWPWDSSWWKPVDNRRDLVRSGALIVAELDRENRQRKPRKADATAPSGGRLR
jgi:hypothetical protein